LTEELGVCTIPFATITRNEQTQGEQMDLVKELKREIRIAENRMKSLAAAIAISGGGNSPNHKTGRRKMSAAARRKISLAQKARRKAQKAKTK
jgi:tellurite resistance protein